MKIGLSILSAGLLIMVSCSSDHKRADYLVKIDSLSAALINDGAVFQSIDTVLIFSNLQNIKSQLAFLDSIDSLLLAPEKAIYFDLGKSFSLFLEENHQIIEEFEISKNQLSNLKHDAENKLIPLNETELYYEQESKAVYNLQNKMELFQNKINSQLKNYNLIHPKIDRLLDSLTKN